MSLQQFRNDPDRTIQTTDFFIDVDGMTTTRRNATGSHLVGGRCRTFEEGFENDVCRLRIVDDGPDYYFPWVNRGVGEVAVPRNAPDGTLVLTGGMNGCGLVVTSRGGELIFYHDADNAALGSVAEPEGSPACKIHPRLYMPTALGAKLAAAASDGRAWLHQLIAVRHDNRWKLYNCGIIIGHGRAVGGRLRLPIEHAYKDGIVKRVTSFE